MKCCSNKHDHYFVYSQIEQFVFKMFILLGLLSLIGVFATSTGKSFQMSNTFSSFFLPWSIWSDEISFIRKFCIWKWAVSRQSCYVLLSGMGRIPKRQRQIHGRRHWSNTLYAFDLRVCRFGRCKWFNQIIVYVRIKLLNSIDWTQYFFWMSMFSICFTFTVIIRSENWFAKQDGKRGIRTNDEFAPKISSLEGKLLFLIFIIFGSLFRFDDWFSFRIKNINSKCVFVFRYLWLSVGGAKEVRSIHD